eukprot:TRINITY_DN1484_c0_g2_i1.p1 TRINITY_DN1484_c0_g2~~TRINITY_DN1484_c0_g2_i1.p1  ORF type:complete len:121 (+),score=20.81 TRINITY_DN1484_c0_g2_i1:78-440(+)
MNTYAAVAVVLLSQAVIVAAQDPEAPSDIDPPVAPETPGPEVIKAGGASGAESGLGSTTYLGAILLMIAIIAVGLKIMKNRSASKNYADIRKDRELEEFGVRGRPSNVYRSGDIDETSDL